MIYKIGNLISEIDERNKYGLSEFFGININKEFMPTYANTGNLNNTKYKVVRKNRFVFSGMQTGRDECIRIAMYPIANPVIVSPAYTTFEVSALDKILPEYLFMIFQSKETDRLGCFLSDASIRANLDWNVFCDISFNIPPLKIQQKYVDVYNALVENQKAYEKGLDNLKLICDVLLDKYKGSEKVPAGKIFSEIDNRNLKGNFTDVYGINIDKQFMPSVADISNVDLKKYKIVQPDQFAYSSMQTGRDECIRIALCKDKPLIVSPAYFVLENQRSDILSEYLMLWFSRKEIDRCGWYASDASIRSNLDLDRFFEFEIPIPSMKIQRAIADIYKVWVQRKEINEKLKQQIKDICPVLIRGAVEEAKR